MKYKKSIINLFSQYVILGVNIIVPLITMPYLVGKLGIEKYGILVYATALMTNFKVLLDFGFEVTATRDIARNVGNAIKIDKLISSVFAVKIVYACVGGVILYLLLNINNYSSEEEGIYIWTFMTVVFQSMVPIWYFQGVQNVNIYSNFNIASKGSYLLMILCFVRNEMDYGFVPICSFVTSFLGFVATTQYMIHNGGVRIKIPRLNEIITLIKNGMHVFYSGVFTNIYSSGGVIILGYLGTKDQVGVYSIGEKIFTLLASIAQPIAKTILPNISSLRKNELNKLFTKYFFSMLSISLIFMIPIYFGSEILLITMFKINNQEINKIFNIQILISIFAFMNVGLVPFIYAGLLEKKLTKITGFFSMIYILICYFGVQIYEVYGAVYSLAIVEIGIWISLMMVLLKYLKLKADDREC